MLEETLLYCLLILLPKTTMLSMNKGEQEPSVVLLSIIRNVSLCVLIFCGKGGSNNTVSIQQYCFHTVQVSREEVKLVQSFNISTLAQLKDIIRNAYLVCLFVCLSACDHILPLCA